MFQKQIQRLLVIVGILLFSCAPASAGLLFTFSGLPIEGADDPTFLPEVSAYFDLNGTGDTLTLVMTYTGGKKSVADAPVVALAQVYSALLWELNGFGGTLAATSAQIVGGSALVSNEAFSFDFNDDVSGHWAFRGGISALESTSAFGVGAIGDINFGEDSFGPANIIDPSKTDSDLENSPPNGGQFTIVPTNVTLNTNGLKHRGPFIQNSVEHTFAVTGNLTLDMITNVQPLFGTDGAALAPEPSSWVLLGMGSLGLIGYRLRRRKRA